MLHQNFDTYPSVQTIIYTVKSLCSLCEKFTFI